MHDKLSPYQAVSDTWAHCCGASNETMLYWAMCHHSNLEATWTALEIVVLEVEAEGSTQNSQCWVHLVDAGTQQHAIHILLLLVSIHVQGQGAGSRTKKNRALLPSSGWFSLLICSNRVKGALRAAVPVIAVPGPTGERAWHFCCVVTFVPENGTAEPAGSGPLADAPCSSAWRNKLQPHLTCPPPKPQHAHLLGDSQLLMESHFSIYFICLIWRFMSSLVRQFSVLVWLFCPTTRATFGIQY